MIMIDTFWNCVVWVLITNTNTNTNTTAITTTNAITNTDLIEAVLEL